MTVVGIIGGGQLGRMTALDAAPLGLSIVTLDPAGSGCPAAMSSSSTVTGSIQSIEAIKQLSACDVVTFEIEHVNAVELAKLEASSAAWSDKGTVSLGSC